MQGFKGTIVLKTGTTYFLQLYLLLKIRLVFSSVLYFEKVWVFSAFRSNFLSFRCYPEYTLFLEKVRAKYILYFDSVILVHDSPIDQIVQTVFGYSLRKK